MKGPGCENFVLVRAALGARTKFSRSMEQPLWNETLLPTCGIADCPQCIIIYVSQQDRVHDDVGLDQIYCDGFSSYRRSV